MKLLGFMLKRNQSSYMPDSEFAIRTQFKVAFRSSFLKSDNFELHDGELMKTMMRITMIIGVVALASLSLATGVASATQHHAGTAQHTWVNSSQKIHPNASGYLPLDKAFTSGYEDTTTPEFLKVTAAKTAHPGKKEAFHIRTLPYSAVTTTITYMVDGWKTTATRTDPAGITGDLVQKWLVPAHATNPTASTTSLLNGKSKTQTTKFIIA